MLVPAVAGVDHRGLEQGRQVLEHAGALVPHDEVGHADGLQIKEGIEQVSPLDREDPTGEKLKTSAPRRLAAISKEERVRVEASVKMKATCVP